MDELTAATILDILRQDVADSLEAQKGKKADGEMTDAQLALYTWQNELNQRVTRLEDFKMARSLSRVIHADANALEMASQEETQASQDRQLALRLGGGGNQGEGAQLLQQQQQQQPRPTGGLPNNEPTRAGSSREAAFQSSGKATRHECVACNKTKPSFETIETPCSHRYCQQCTIKLFESAITDESLFPPRCCRVPIPLDPIRGLLGNDLSTRFEVRTIERSDPNRIYCSNPLCSQHILPRQVVENVGTCTSCSQRTCTGCKRAAHQGDCPDETQEVLQMAQEEGWMRCFHCQNVVELTTGCNHITCRCGSEFCYVCGRKWKRCRCKLWEENRLLDRAEQVAIRDRQVGQAPPQPAELQQLAQELLQDECFHDRRWRRVPGSHWCDECGYRFPVFILECRDCRLRACVQCRYNRL